MATFREAEQARIGFVGADQDFKLLSSIGVRWDRPHPGPFNWQFIEPAYDRVYDWTQTDGYVDIAQLHGFATVATIWPFHYSDQMVCNYARPGALGFVFWQLPRWLYKPCDMDAYQAFVSAMVERYDGDGVDDYPNLKYPIKYWEASNEPDMSGLELAFFLGTPQDYAEILKATYEAVKEADAGATVLQGGAAGMLDQKMRGFWETVFSIPDIGDYFDIANIHSISGSPTFFVPEFKQLLQSHGLADKPVWVTEVSLSTDPTPASGGRFLSEQEKGLLLKQSFTAAFSAGAEKAFYTILYGFDDPKMAREALVMPDGTRLPAFHAFVEVIEEAASATPPTTTQATPEPTPVPVPVARLPITFKGDWPGGADRARQAFDRVYPYLVKYLGEPFTIGNEGVTLIWDTAITSPDQVGWYAEDNSISLGPIPHLMEQRPDQPPYQAIDSQIVHEIGHLFLDAGDTTINFAFGQWIWEAHSLVGQALAEAAMEAGGGSSNKVPVYDTTTNLGWDRVNGVLQDGNKYERTIVDSSATAALRLMTEVLSSDTGLDYIRRINAGILGTFRASGDPSISAEEYRSVLNKAAGGHTIDGLSAGDWLFAQPVANIQGALGSYVVVKPFYSAGPSGGVIELMPTAFEVATFIRQAGPRIGDGPLETPLSDLEVTLTIVDAWGESVGEATLYTGGRGTATVDSFSQGSPLDTRKLTPGAYLIKARALYERKQLEAVNFFVVQPPDMSAVTAQDSRLFIVPMNAAGTELRAVLVDQLHIARGQAQTPWPGVLVVTAEAGASVEVSLSSFQTEISKPVTARLVPLRVPASAP